MIKTLRQLLQILTPAERRNALLVLVMVVVMSLVEMASVASVMPFLAALGNPEAIETNRLLSGIYQRGGFDSTTSFLIALGAISAVLVVFSSIFRSTTEFVLARYAHMRRATIGARLLRAYLRQPYTFFLNRNSADLSKSILSEVDQLVTAVISPIVQIVARGVSLIALVALLIMVDPVMALVVAGVLGTSYALIYLSARGILGRIGPERRHANGIRFQAASEAFGGIKEIKVAGCEPAYMIRFEDASGRFSSRLATAEVFSQVPRYLIEGVGFSSFIAFCVVLLIRGGNLGEVLPILGLYGFAAYRMLPAAQGIYSGFSQLRFGTSALDAIHADICLEHTTAPIVAAVVEPLKLCHGIRFEELEYRYPGAEHSALAGITLGIPVNTTVGFIGTTGAGKTTLIDLLLGLLSPTDGRILIDETPMEGEALVRWQRSIGYVPQHIYLADASVTANIAFGIDPKEVDHKAVERAARAAQLHTFISEQLPDRYATKVGEGGVRLSGGQRQRVGIARALYHNPDVLVFDEATSALDSATESAVMKAIIALHGTTTIIIIAHRLSTLAGADWLFRLENGRLADQGPAAEILGTGDLSVSAGAQSLPNLHAIYTSRSATGS